MVGAIGTHNEVLYLKVCYLRNVMHAFCIPTQWAAQTVVSKRRPRSKTIATANRGSQTSLSADFFI